MNNIIVEFQRQSKRTAPFQAEAANKQEFEWFLSNYTLGLIGETLELSQVLDQHENYDELDVWQQDAIWRNFIKELGDVWHYAVNLLSVLGEEYDNEKVYDAEKGLKYLSGDFVELVKKGIYHGHGVDKNVLIDKLYGIIGELIDYSGSHLNEILDKNIAKLKLRYPDSFTVEDSIARVDVK